MGLRVRSGKSERMGGASSYRALLSGLLLAALCLVAQPVAPDKRASPGLNDKGAGRDASPQSTVSPQYMGLAQINPVTITNWPHEEWLRKFIDAVVLNWPLILIGVFATWAALRSLNLL